LQRRDFVPMRDDAPPVEEPGRAEQKGALAHAAGTPHVCGRVPDPADERHIAPERIGVRAADDDDGVQPRHGDRSERLRRDDEAAARPNRAAGFR